MLADLLLTIIAIKFFFLDKASDESEWVFFYSLFIFLSLSFSHYYKYM